MPRSPSHSEIHLASQRFVDDGIEPISGYGKDRRLKLSQLRDVIAISECGSLRAAGRLLGTTQPSITRSIRELEAELGVALFERHAKGVRLTDMGRAFVNRARAVESEVRQAREEIHQLRGGTTGEVSIALSTATIMSLMPRAVAEFRRRFPSAVLKIHESFFQPIERDLINGRIDFYVGPIDREKNAAQFIVEQLFPNYRMIVARKGHPLLAVRDFAEISSAKWLRPTLSSNIVEGDFEDMLARAGLPRPEIVLHARSALITIVALCDSDLLTVVPRQWLDLPLLANLIQPLALPRLVAAPISIVRRRDMPLTPIAEHLCDLMRRVGTQYGYDYPAAAGLSMLP